jgi:hypothetical protein
MLIYRAEKDGRGVFCDGFMFRVRSKVAEEMGEISFYDTDEPDPYRHPGPDEDRLLRGPWRDMDCADQAAYLFGFASQADFLAWFDSERVRVKMKELGAVLCVYRVDPKDVIQGETQLIFLGDEAELVDVKAIPTLS